MACGGNLISSTGGPVTSPNYPSNYGNNEICEWLITTTTGSVIRLTFDSFDVEDGFDFLKIYDGANIHSPQFESLTGSESVSPITSTSNVMFLIFTSDESDTAQGFQFSYSEDISFGIST
ncbi:CUB domain-containing protein 2-like [Branchiostoma lanceolatum]|uniref:CUB domain-containing protein 2-like n=1 Tax=Branchiostoma lanceolatum TaxID=7740 RepID=UPI0034514D1C